MSTYMTTYLPIMTSTLFMNVRLTSTMRTPMSYVIHCLTYHLGKHMRFINSPPSFLSLLYSSIFIFFLLKS